MYVLCAKYVPTLLDPEFPDPSDGMGYRRPELKGGLENGPCFD